MYIYVYQCICISMVTYQFITDTYYNENIHVIQDYSMLDPDVLFLLSINNFLH